ncbi:hypothetical protein UC34_08905 [Pandoraea vervacti]|uniref:Glycine zipper 2TM domain-containing protein n=1 Tax=Pandoraea vervacti TaxID=656178 RepID=A0ABM5SX63_9BURK|nr:glycine zipper 2TM domain-containing protein [Pandoraea vervacti]AJP57090.1 hypothetical protein UC34_08905 [Pandoraea vervacti]
MDNDLQPRRMHPLVAAAAGSIVVVSLLGVAAITGVLPVAKSTDGPAPTSNSAQYALTNPQQAALPGQSPSRSAWQAPAQQPAQNAQNSQGAQYAAQQAPTERAPATQPSYAQQAPAQRQASTCSTCGTVQSVEPIRTEGHATGLGAVGGAVAGGLLGNQFGAGNGRTAMTVVGALGGGLAGNEVEKRVRSDTVYRVYVRMDTGKTRYWTYQSAPGVQPGDRVRLENNGLVRAS